MFILLFYKKLVDQMSRESRRQLWNYIDGSIRRMNNIEFGFKEFEDVVRLHEKD